MDSTKQLEIEDCRPVVKRFAVLMEQKLREKDPVHPNGWQYDRFTTLYKRMLEEAAEIIGAEGTNEQAMECVAVANMAMMLCDQCLWGIGK
jgi:hypothetical protein